MNLITDIKITKCLDYTNASAVREGATLDMLGYDGVIALMVTGDINASASGDIHFETSTSDWSGSQDLAGTKIEVLNDDDNQVFAIDLYKPLEQYVRAVVTKDTSNNQAETVTYIQYKGIKRPEDNNVTLVTSELHVSPARGTK